MRTALLVDVGASAVRMCLWVALLVGLAPRVMFRRVVRDSVGRVVRMALIVEVVAVVLWLVNLLHPGTFLFAIFACAIILEFEIRPGFLRRLVRRTWARFADACFDPVAMRSQLPAVGAAVIGNPHGGASAGVPVVGTGGETSLLQFLQRSSSIARASWTGSTGHGGAPTGASLPIGPRARRFFASRRGRAVVTLFVAGALGCVLAIARATRPYPINTAEAVQLLQREGWLSRAGAWLPDLVNLHLAERLTGSLPLIASIAVLAPLTLLAAWSGMALMRRFAPEAPPWLGALVCALPPARAFFLGHAASPSQLLAVALPWACFLAAGRARRRGWTFRVPWLLAIVHPVGGVGALGTAGAAALAWRTVARPRYPFRIVVTLLVTLGSMALLAWGSGALRETLRSGESAAFSATQVHPGIVIVASLASAWLLVGVGRRRSAGAVAAGRALGVLTMVAALLGVGLGGRVVSFAPPLATGLTAFATALAVVDLRARAGATGIARLRGVAGRLAAVVVAALVTWLGVERVPEAGLRADVADVAVAMRHRHLPWTFTVVGPPSALPAFAGASWFVDGSRIASTYPAQSYWASRSVPGRAFGTRYTYILLGAEVSTADAAMSSWIQDLEHVGLRPRLVREYSSGALSVYALENAEMER